MLLKRGLGLILCLMVSSLLAGTEGGHANYYPNHRGLYLGLGGAYDFFRYQQQTEVSLAAVSGFPPLGTFTAHASQLHQNAQGLAAEAHLGYLKNLNEQWLLGLELMYQYAGLSKQGEGRSFLVANPAINVTDRISLRQDEVRLQDAWFLPFFIGHQWTRGFIYLGVGPALLQAKNSVNRLFDTDSALYIGNLKGFSNKKSVWGGVVQLGLAYYLNPAWFLKLNYSYAASRHFQADNQLSYRAANNGGLNNGNLYFNNNNQVHLQAVAVSLNRVFDW